jgi:hypothetical protein
MDKIKQLMIESGLSAEAAAKICESLDGYETQLKTKYESAFKARLNKAKKVCAEEVAEHKREMSRRIQIFFEAKKNSIEESLRKVAINKETEAAAQLERIHAMLEGHNIDGQPNSELKAQVQHLGQKVKALKEDRDKAVTKANQTVELAEKVMARNRTLERTIKESQQPTGGKAAKQPAKRIDEGRRRGRTRTPRPTLAQNQDALTEGAPPQRQQSQGGSKMVGPAQIAQDMDPNI